MAKTGTENENENGPCRIAEILQYACDVQLRASGRPQVHCFPIPRIFRICDGRPAVEITRLVDIDIATGEVVIPKDASAQKLTVRAAWKDVVRHEVPGS